MIKTQRQSSVLARHITRLNNDEGIIVATYTTSQKIIVQIYMLDSSSSFGAPGFYGVKKDDVTFPMDPTGEDIPEVYRADSSDYDSDDDEYY